MNEVLMMSIVYPTIGGLILNLMPCVFPMLAIKLMSLVGSSSKESMHVRLGGLAYTFGVLVCFWILAVAIVLLKAGGEKVGWGFQLQNPIFIFLLAQLFFFIGLIFIVGMDLSFPSSFSFLNQLTAKEGLAGEFFAGALVGVVSSPCTGPYMAASLGYALSQEPSIIFLTFTSLGVGVALPFTVLCFFPSLVKLLPRPGQWMVTLKELCAFPMFLAAIWLVWVLGAQVNRETLMFALVGFTGLAFWVWMLKLEKNSTTYSSKILKWGVTLGLIAYFGFGMTSKSFFSKISSNSAASHDPTQHGLTWLEYSDSLIAKLIEEERTIFVDFTAEWCISCKANEAAVFSSQEVLDELKIKNVVLVKADWTDGNDQILEVLTRYERSGVPLYLMFSKTQQPAPLILPQILTPTIFLDYLSRVQP